MKILTVTLKNLNSLRGTWRIDLTDKAYTSSGIFAITGPTGAGKTTIFDAVCLALYSQTSRLGKIGGQFNEIMTRRTNECFAKVRFEAHGREYLCEWVQVRAKGKFQTARHTISYADTGEVISGKKHSTSSIVAEITGLDFSRFCQSMMLEQGRFDRFLTADKNSRAAVLELITGTGIYSRISSAVYDRMKEEHGKLDGIQAEIDAETLRLGGMTEESVQAEISRTEEEISRAEGELRASTEILAWLDEKEKLSRSVDVLKAELESHVKSSASLADERQILEASERAGTLEGDYALLCAKRDVHTKTDAENSAMSGKLSSQESECSQYAGYIPAMSEELARLKGDISGNVGEAVAGIESAVRDYLSRKSDVADAENACVRTEREAEEATFKRGRIEAQGKASAAELEKIEARYRTLRDQLTNMEARTREAVFSEARVNLVDGEECPVCGSIHHPKAAQNSSGGENPDDLFRMKAKLKEERDRAEEARNAADNRLKEERDKWWKAHLEEVSALNGKARCVEELSARKKKLYDAEVLITDLLRPLHISWHDDTDEILRLTHEWSAKIDALEKRIQYSQQRVSTLQALIMSGHEQLDAKRRELDALSTELGGLEASFREKLSMKSFPDEESFRLARRTPAELDGIRARIEIADTRMNELRAMLSQKQKELDTKTAMNLTSQPRGEIDSLNRKNEVNLRELHQKKGSLAQNLTTAKSLTAKIASLNDDYERQKVTAGNWEELCGLIGSAKGDKYSIFAQKITLALVVNNANKYLKGMNGRYTLILTPDDENLAISVRDNEQAGEIRPTVNLSGGERFIISLALALGLSQISGSKAQVDSLFIDEGFGSLDDDALNAALEALGEIRRNGRMIGIISHVQGISEAISTKIRVIRKSEGTSIIEGPGCSGSI